SAAGVQLGSDAIAQVQVFSANYSAAYGRGSGGVLNSISRSGTEEFHGTLFEYLRNSKLDARRFIDGPQPPPFKRNQFGFTLTGPLAKDKTYFMGSFEAMRDRLSTTSVDFFPDAFVRKGIIKDKDGNTLNACVYEQNKPACVFPKVLPYLNLYPIPNGATVGDGIAENRAPVFQPTNENFFVVRVDHKISDKDSFFARYSFDDATSISSGPSFLYRTKTLSRQQYLTLVESHIFSLSAVNSFRLGYTRPVSFTVDDTTFQVPPDLFFVPGAAKFGSISVPGLTSFGPSGGSPESRMMNSFQFADNLLLQRGDHALQFGFDIHRYRWDVYNQTQKFGEWTFNSLPSFLQGGPSGTRLNVALPGSNNQKALRQTLLGFYAQDEFRLRPNLRLSLGLRYEFSTIIHDKDGKTAAVRDPIHDSGPTIGLYFAKNPSLLDFSPRWGLRWSPGGSGNTVVNAGFGIYYDQMIEYVVHQSRSSVPFHTRVSRVNFNATTTFPNAVAAVLEDSTKPLAQTPDYNHAADTMVLRYDFNVEQQLPGGWTGRAAYVGARGNHVFRSAEINQIPVPIVRGDGSLCFPPEATVVLPEQVYPSCPAVSKERAGPVNPAFSSIQLITGDAQSFYNALQLSASKNLSRGFSIQGNYTYSKSVDDASTHQDSGYSQYGLVRSIARGLSNFDIRHRLSVNYFYTLPFGGGRSGVLPYLFGAWRLGGILAVRSGSPFSPEINVPTRGYLFSASLPNLNPGQSNNPVRGGTERYFDPSAFSVPLPGTLGNVGRNTITGPSVFNVDISLQKEFLIDAKRRLQFRAEFFNLPNHTNLDKPGNTTVFSGAYPGRLNPTVGRIRSTATTARQIQFALRFSF
ncbi:MAG: TonB-dependent receptor, partial [Acidobacteria bacterium]|nr:TonB-dependent receptor [Acidobacteriota bacterium]